MKPDATEPVSAQLAREGHVSGEALRHIANLERVAFARVMQVTSNGKFPHWSIERWMAVATFSGMVWGGIWFAGTQWSDVKHDVQGLTRAVADLKAVAAEDRARMDLLLEAMRKQIEATQRRR